jgi:nucleoside-diphosphate kinase
MKEATLVVIKPDAFSKCLVGDILSRFSRTNLQIAGAKIVKVTRELAEAHYEAIQGKPFFDQTVRYLMGEFHNQPRTLALVYTGESAIQQGRDITGVTNPEEATPSSVRGAYGRVISQTGLFENIVHASTSLKEAEREVKLWFEPEELAFDIFPVEEVKVNLKKKVWKKS